MIFNSQFVLDQVCKAYLRSQSIKENKTFEKPNCSQVSQKLFRNYVEEYKHKEHCISHGDLILSKEFSFELCVIEKNVIQDLFGKIVELDVIENNRFIINNTLYHSKN